MPADLVIGIDFGMTYTGVAYYVPGKTDPEQPRLFQKWPGKQNKVENKVSTSLVYNEDRLIAWGFLCDAVDESDYPDAVSQQCFKLWLDHAHLKEVFPKEDIVTHKDVKQWFTDFLSRLYRHIEEDFSHGPYKEEWHKRVQYVFSIPTTWKSHNVHTTFKECIKAAGFRKGGQKHQFGIGLTEAEAAAIYTCKGKALDIGTGDMILVCDAGGGTTDAAILEAVVQRDGESELEQYGPDSGAPVGSTNIDIAFKKLIEKRLNKIADSLPKLTSDDPNWAERNAWAMTRGAFQDFKCGFGTSDGTHATFKIEVPDFPKGKSFPEVSIEKRKMKFKREDLQKIFDEQLEGIYSTLDEQLEYLKRHKPAKKVDYLVLSGGLGSSIYIQSEITKRYECNGTRHSNGKSLKVFAADNPQTAVVQGLILNEAQQRDRGKSVMKSRTSPASYGVIGKQLYDPTEHFGMDIEVDEVDGQTYATNLIRWVVKKGDSVSSDTSLSYNFERRLDPTSDPRTDNWESEIVICWKDRAFLPKSRNEDTPPLCTLVSDTSRLKMKDFEYARFGFLWHKGYYIAKYEVKLKIDVADIAFEVWCNEKKLTKDQRIRVEWKEGAEMTRPSGKVEKVRDIF